MKRSRGAIGNGFPSSARSGEYFMMDNAAVNPEGVFSRPLGLNGLLAILGPGSQRQSP